jgi:4-alpha-glucanotransferase
MPDLFPRESGILLHPTSLPGPHGIGDLGDAAFRFVDWMQRAGLRLWQVMPLGPTGFGDSPYASPSAFAGNPWLVSLSWLGGDGLLEPSDWEDVPHFPDDHVEFEQVVPFRRQMLRKAFDRFRRGAGSSQRQSFTAFCEQEKRWLDDYSLFMALKEHYGGVAWTDWPEETRLREPAALDRMREELGSDVRFHQFVQFQFRRQWTALKAYANERNIRIIGDIPIFVAGDSADVWTNQSEFKLDADGLTVEVAGVPPDPFSETGQIWGNPVYDWKAMRDNDYRWWVDRIRVMLDTVDVVRIDHFRGFAAAWIVPAGAESAVSGHWERTPGAEVFAAIERELGDVPIIVEDLGVITPDVVSLREALGFPGMKVLQFAFENDPTNMYLPHNFEPHTVVYTATHDNQTTVGWFQTRGDQERAVVQGYLGGDGADIAWDLIRTALASVSNTAIIPMQDVLRLGDEARMNVPGQAHGNWSWRMRWDHMDGGIADGLRYLVNTYGRGDAHRKQEPNPWDYTTPGTKYPATDPFA